MTNEMSLDVLMTLCNKRLHAIFNHYLANVPSDTLKKAMHYTLFNGGKQLRPLLLFATGHIFDAPLENLDIPAAAIEMIHIYSLIHDDLPCMDNADLRRGKPACHKVFGDGMAVLTGDALQTLALQIISSHQASLTADKRNQMMCLLTESAGPFGMAGGQALDITLLTNKTLTADELEKIYRLKTGALFSASIMLGRLASTDENKTHEIALQKCADSIGLAFQIQDDILDIESATEISGKPQGIDHQNKKTTYPTLAGLPLAKEKVSQLYQEALASLEIFGYKANLLRALMSQMIERHK